MGKLTKAQETLKAHWFAFCDADPVPPDFTEEMEAAGLVEIRPVVSGDIEGDDFAAERGIVPGGMIWVLTPAGRAALARAQETSR